MNQTVLVAQATDEEAVLPERVQEALGQLVGAAKEGLLALSVGVGLGVLTELMEEEVDEVVGPKGKHNADRVAVRHGHEDGEVTLGGRRVEVRRPRVRTADGESEVPLQTYEHIPRDLQSPSRSHPDEFCPATIRSCRPPRCHLRRRDIPSRLEWIPPTIPFLPRYPNPK